MSLINVASNFLDGFVYVCIGALIYRFLWGKDSRSHEKIRGLKVENRRLWARLYVSERINNEWEMVWMEHFNNKRSYPSTIQQMKEQMDKQEKQKCQE